jgi:2-iminobutanoate/2-iminopropanoate deaminase
MLASVDVTGEERYMSKLETIYTPSAPAAIGPYSQAVRAGDLVFCSGQIPIVPETGEMIIGEVEAQTRRVLENLQAVLRAAGCDLCSVVKTTIFLTDLGDFARVNEVYGSFFPHAPPARATVQVAALPKGSKVEIEAIALRER